jgi:hypothetical protein
MTSVAPLVSHRSSLATLLDLGLSDILGSGSSLLGTSLGLSLSLITHLGLLLIKVLLLELLLGLGKSGVLLGIGLSTSSLDLLKGHTNDGLSDTGSLSGLLALDLIDTDLLVHASPGLSPGELNGLSSLVVEAAGLRANEEMSLTVLGSELDTVTGVDLHLGEDSK